MEEAIRAMGGISALARRLGVAQPTVSLWRRIPAGRVLAVEALTGLSRTVLRPDLYPASDGGYAADVDDVDRARSEEYALLASLLLRAPDAGLLARISGLKGDADTPLGQAHEALGRAAEAASADGVKREYHELFIGVGRGELLPYASYYLTGFLNERPLARLRADMQRLGLERAEGQPEPEDHLGSLCEMMSGFAAGRFALAGTEEQNFFERHVAPWAGRFFADLASAKAAGFYRAVGTAGRLFIEIETEAFALETRRSA